jgi:hypothetical protein
VSQWQVFYWDLDEHTEHTTFVSGDLHLDAILALEDDGNYEVRRIEPA